MTTNGRTLNDLQFPGPRLQKDIVDIIHDFRAGKFGICADIKKMYRQVEVDQRQWNSQRIFWRESKNLPLQEYWLTVVTYGLTASPYVAVRALIQCAIDHEKEHPIGAKLVHNNFYVDDMLACCDSIEDAHTAKDDATALLAKGGFELAKCVSNAPTIMSPESEHSLIPLPADASPSVLGIKWDYVSDTFMFQVTLNDQPKHMTKRDLASASAKVFDPLLLLAPVMVKAKRFLKEIWRLKIDWDSQIPVELQMQWTDYYKDLENLNDLRIPRWIGTSLTSTVQLHVFTDASEAAYGAAAYVVTIHPDGSRMSHLVMAKSKLSPKEATTIPRLELCAAEVGSALQERLLKKHNCNDSDIFMWTDSQIVLHWLHKESDKLKIFVGNKVAAIQKRTKVEHWRHVKSEHNPADLISRGMSSAELSNSPLWWNGPRFLCDHTDPWPPWRYDPIGDSHDMVECEARPHKSPLLCAKLVYKGRFGHEVDLLAKASSLQWLVRLTAFGMRVARRLFNNWRANKPHHRDSVAKTLLPDDLVESNNLQLTFQELELSLKLWIRQEQQASFPEEYSCLKRKQPTGKDSRLRYDTPFLDEYQIVRVWGRLDNLTDEYDRKHPMILDSKSNLVKLLIRDAHDKTLHGTVDMTRYYLRNRYHIIGARVAVRRHVRSCITCARHAAHQQIQFMADLPSVRVTPAPAFHSTGVDYAGPFRIKQGRGQKVLKAYVSVYVCMVTKAIHLELVPLWPH